MALRPVTQVMVYGGEANGTVLADAWLYNGTQWQQLSQFGPRPTGRARPVLEVDQRGDVMVWGGQEVVVPGARSNECWTWNSYWTQRSAPSAPVPTRDRAASTYDFLRGISVVFGGDAGNGTLLGDTLEWNGSGWTLRTPPQSPPVRLGHAMAYDQARNRTVLYGGTGLPGSLRNDTWEWDGTNWTQVLVSGPGVRHSHAMAFLSQLNRVVLFGGEDRFGVLLGDTWTYDGTAWTQLAIPGPAPRRGHGMVLRLGMDRLVLFGGRLDAQTLADDTWELIGPRAASANAWGTGCGNLAMAPQAPPVIGATATALVTGSPSMLSYVALGFNNSYTTFGGLPTSLSGFGMPGCWLYHAADLAVFGPTAAINAIAQQYALPLPPFAGLLGLRLYLQAWAPAPAANAAGLITSNVMSWDIGSF